MPTQRPSKTGRVFHSRYWSHLFSNCNLNENNLTITARIGQRSSERVLDRSRRWKNGNKTVRTEGQQAHELASKLIKSFMNYPNRWNFARAKRTPKFKFQFEPPLEDVRCFLNKTTKMTALVPLFLHDLGILGCHIIIEKHLSHLRCGR